MAWRNRLRDSFWAIPTLFLVAGIGLAMLLVELDGRWQGGRDLPFVFSGGPNAARSLLSTIATSMLTAATLVFSITMLVLQLASGQFSPRVLGTFLQDRHAKFTLGLFAAAFAYALVVLANTDAPPGEEETRSFAVSATVAFALVLLSVGGLVSYVHHTAQSIRVSSILRAISRDTEAAIERLYPEDIGEAPRPETTWSPGQGAVPVLATGSGFVLGVDDKRLMQFAAESDARVVLSRRVGDYVAEGTGLMSVYGVADADRCRELAGAVLLGKERTVYQDAPFGFRQLVDIAERALSPGINDPTTAVQALNEMYFLLLKLGRRSIPSPVRVDDAGEPRLLLPRPAWDDYVHLAFDEISEYGRDSSQVRARLRQVLDELEANLPASRLGPVAEHRAALRRLSPSDGLAHEE